MRRRLVSLLMAAVLIPFGTGQALALGTLDQDVGPGGGCSAAPGWQTFTAGLTGGLDTVSLYGVQIVAGSWIVAVQAVVAGVPSGVDLGTGSAPWAINVQGWTDVPISPVPQVTAGTQYAIVVSPSPGLGGSTACWFDTAAPYAGGTGIFGSDRAFRTYVTVAAAPPSVVTGVAVNSRVATSATGTFGESVSVPVGSLVWRTISLLNNGTTALSHLAFGDSGYGYRLPGSCPPLPETLASGASYVCTFSQTALPGTTTYLTVGSSGFLTDSERIQVTGTGPGYLIEGVGSKLGLAYSDEGYSTTTKVAALNGYVTWQANLGLAAVDHPVGVYVSTKDSDGRWTPWSRLTSRWAETDGIVTFSWRTASPSWISVRFSLDGTSFTKALQARWR